MNYVTWFCILFLIGSYIRLYGLFDGISTKKWGLLSIFMFVLSSCSILVLRYLNSYPYRFVSDSNAIFAVLLSVCLFMYFKDVNIKHSKVINSLGGATFGVLLIHANSDTMRHWLWIDTLKNTEQFYSENLIIHAVVSTLAIFFICAIIDIIRLNYIEKPLFKYIKF